MISKRVALLSEDLLLTLKEITLLNLYSVPKEFFALVSTTGAECVDELADLLAADTTLYGHGYGAAELRGIMARREWPSFIDRPALIAQLHRILDLAEDGLRRRGFGEEPLLVPLRRRADALTNPALEQLDRLARGETIEEIADDYGSLSPEEVHHA